MIPTPKSDNAADGGSSPVACSTSYHAGMTCQCGAHNENECGCPDVDWTPSEVYQLRALMRELCNAVHDRLRDDPTPESRMRCWKAWMAASDYLENV